MQRGWNFKFEALRKGSKEMTRNCIFGMKIYISWMNGSFREPSERVETQHYATNNES